MGIDRSGCMTTSWERSEAVASLLASRLIAAEDAMAAAVGLEASITALDESLWLRRLLLLLGLYDKVTLRADCKRANTPSAVSEVSIPDIPLAGLAPSDTVNEKAS